MIFPYTPKGFPCKILMFLCGCVSVMLAEILFPYILLLRGSHLFLIHT